MAYVLTPPESTAAVAADVVDLGSVINEANAAAASRTSGVLAAAADEVSAATATLFNEDTVQRIRPGIPGGDAAGRGLPRRVCPGTGGCR